MKNGKCFCASLLYYTGLNRRNIAILNTIHKDLQENFDFLSSALDVLQNYQIGIDISIPEEVLPSRLDQVKLTREQSDQITDIHPSVVESPEEIDKKSEFNEGLAFIQTLWIFGNCLKNMEFIDRPEKEAAFNDYLLGLALILAIMTIATEGQYKKRIEKMRSLPEQYSEKEIEELEKIAQ